MWNIPSSAYPRTSLELARVCHHPKACNGGMKARALVFFYFFFSFNLDLLFLLGVLVIIFRRRIPHVIVGGGHGPSKTENSP
jgi:hypothetical protein